MAAAGRLASCATPRFMRGGTAEKVRAQAHALRSTAGSAIRTNNTAARGIAGAREGQGPQHDPAPPGLRGAGRVSDRDDRVVKSQTVVAI